MKISGAFVVLAAAFAQAAYPGDIVQSWVDQSAILANGTVIGGLQSVPSAWFEAVVQAAVLLAADRTQSKSHALQQLAVSHAAHDSLIWVFHGAKNEGATNSKLKAVLPAIGLNLTSPEALAAIKTGRHAAEEAITARSDDGTNYFVDYTFGSNKTAGLYQTTTGGNPVPDNPQARSIRLFAGIRNASQFRAPPPPALTDPQYETDLLYVKAQGNRTSAVRLAYDTQTAYFWRESAPAVWNRIATAVLGNTYATNVHASAKFYAQLNFALANAGIAAWDTKYFYNSWRPETAIRSPLIFLASKNNVSDPSFLPLLTPTPSHQDYVSTHSTFGGAGSYVIRKWNGGDKIDVTWSSNVTIDNIGVVTRRFTNLTAAAIENGHSRVFGGLHFPFASGAGIELGERAAKATLEAFDDAWDEF